MLGDLSPCDCHGKVCMLETGAGVLPLVLLFITLEEASCGERGAEEAARGTVNVVCSRGKILLQKYEELLKQAEVFD